VTIGLIQQEADMSEKRATPDRNPPPAKEPVRDGTKRHGEHPERITPKPGEEPPRVAPDASKM
jgi:hypothetical protein